MRTAFIYIDGARMAVGRGAGYVYASINGDKQFYDASITKPEELPQLIVGNFDVVMISTTTLPFIDARRVIHGIKALEDIPIVVGGVHPIVIGPPLLEEYPEIDYLCIGEGESFVSSFLDNYGKESLYDIDNLVYRRDGIVHANPVGPPEDLTKLPDFPWKIFAKVMDRRGLLYVNATRGCPYACTYCCNTAYLKLYKQAYVRSRPIEQVIEELSYLKRHYDFKMFFFGDDMIFSDQEYTMNLFAAVSKLDKPYGCMSRVECIDEEVANHLRDTGCRYVGMGVECGDEDFRKKYLNRHMTNDQIRTAFKLLKERNIWTTSYNMVGWPFPGEAERSRATIELNKEIKADFVQVTWFYPFPGTKLYEHCVKNDLIDHDATVQTFHINSSLKAYIGKSKPFESGSVYIK